MKANLPRLAAFAAIALAAATLGTWVATGSHRGWTQNQIPVTVHDEITGIEAVHYQPGFVAGIDVLALGLGGSVALGLGATLAGRRPRSSQQS